MRHVNARPNPPGPLSTPPSTHGPGRVARRLRAVVLATALAAVVGAHVAGVGAPVAVADLKSSLAASTLPEGVEAYGPLVLVAKEDAVPVRTEPGFVYREIRFLRKGQEVVIDGRQGPWLHVRPQGFILEEHLVPKEKLDEPPPPRAQRMVPIRDGIRVRASASTDAEVARTLKAADVVEVLAEQDGWWQLADGGFVASSLLRAAPDEAALPADIEEPQEWTVKASSANVRAERQPTAPIVRKVPSGQAVTVTSVQDGWAEVEGGWIRADLLQPPAATAEDEPALPRRTMPVRSGGPRRWSLVDLNGVIFEVTDITRSPLLPQIKKEMRETGVLEEDWTFLGLTIGVPNDATYRFNYSPERNSTLIEDVDGQRFGNVYARGPFERLPEHLRRFFTETTVSQGEKFDGLLLFKPSLKPANIREITMFIGGRQQRLYEADPAVP